MMKMLIKIDRIPKIIRKRPFLIQLDAVMEDRVDKCFREFISDREARQDTASYWDGEMLFVTHYDKDKNVLEVAEAKYSLLVYSRTHKDLDVRSLFVSALFQTLDGYYVIVKSNHQKYNILGGMVDIVDLDGDTFNPEVTLSRELMEELKLDLYDKRQIKSYELTYLKTPNPGWNYGVFYTGVLNFTSQEFMQYFDRMQDEIDHEVVELLLMKDDELDKLDLSDDDISYLREYLDLQKSKVVN